jgi:two-component system, chemotaxis family, CheB/CheR fusion protein
MARMLPPVRRRVLVIEDEDDVRYALRLLLSLSGYEVREATDSREGVRLALEWRPDAVISDIGLPGSDGWEVGRRLRGRLGKGALLVALTAYDLDEDYRRSREAGFDHHLSKPADPEVLLRLLGEGA